MNHRNVFINGIYIYINTLSRLLSYYFAMLSVAFLWRLWHPIAHISFGRLFEEEISQQIIIDQRHTIIEYRILYRIFQHECPIHYKLSKFFLIVINISHRHLKERSKTNGIPKRWAMPGMKHAAKSVVIDLIKKMLRKRLDKISISLTANGNAEWFSHSWKRHANTTNASTAATNHKNETTKESCSSCKCWIIFLELIHL